MSPPLRLALPLAWLALGACALAPSTRFPPDDAARAASDLPAAFQSPAGPAPDGTCRNPLHDPRDGAALQLARAAEGRGDYEVPSGRYAVAAGELLRIDCASGAAIGIVTR